ncbi:DUF4250 domain-containing protein [Roseburia sp. 499]|uniref:DUF4250 domain-containing protein n=1 Tax=Roseburia sp. 499 TaxID=1261634 RepID=UPI0009535755|nr:DUF4250 domain-containing protein [Roseburia sp. 499]WVK71203.1 DUF4250 domain-containing protein [Roseburia sp. 499]
MNQIPKDPVILLSYINTQLRDFYPSLEELGKSLNISLPELTDTLASIDYCYDSETNQFI